MGQNYVPPSICLYSILFYIWFYISYTIYVVYDRNPRPVSSPCLSPFTYYYDTHHESGEDLKEQAHHYL